MWASCARCEGTCSSNVRSLHWQESSDGQGGWLVSGCDGGTVGVSWAGNRACEFGGREDNVACTEGACFYKSHFILKEHHIGEVRVVRWSPSGDRLATYDSWGRIIIWRNRANILAYLQQVKTPLTVTDMQWSPCGYYILVCGKEGCIQMFSSINMMNLVSLQLEATTRFISLQRPNLTTCAWNRTISRIALGTQTGEIVLLDPNNIGSSISSVSLKRSVSVQSIQWYGPVAKCFTRDGGSYDSQSLSAYLQNGVHNGLMAWNTSNTLLAVVGYSREDSTPLIRFVNQQGNIVFTLCNALPHIPKTQAPILSIIWGLKDSTLFISQDASIYSVEVQEDLPTLQYLCQSTILDNLLGGSEKVMESLPLPWREVERLRELKAPAIPALYDIHTHGCLEDLLKPLSQDQFMHCTIEPSGHGGYILKYEFLNQYIPLLHAKKKTRKVSSLLTGGYQIVPAFQCLHSQQSKAFHWASKPLQAQPEVQRSQRWFAREQSRSVLKKLKSAFRPGHNYAIMDTMQQEIIHPSPMSSQTAVSKDPELPILAEVQGSLITNQFGICTPSPQFGNGNLGTVKISTYYIVCRPKKLNINLFTVKKEGKDDCSGEEVIVLQSKEPDWNHRSQIFELDFGGRVTRDSTKNFQLEIGGQVVLQFGRSNKNCFCLDFQAPFSPVHAFCIAVACIL